MRVEKMKKKNVNPAHHRNHGIHLNIPTYVKISIMNEKKNMSQVQSDRAM